MKRTLSLIALFLSAQITLFASIDRVEPPFWWAKMPVSELQLQLYGENIGQYRAEIDYAGVTIAKQISVDSPNYLFIYLDITQETQAGDLNIALSSGDKRITHSYELRPRESAAGRNQGFDSSDLIYLMIPDRFANGDPSNDSIPGMLEGVNRDDPEKRQGGDIAGIIENLDYIKDAGMTAVWFTPIFENDMPADYGAYHGYAATDMYKVDRRVGGNESYKNLVDTVHSKGMKVIMDMIHNHVGIEHWWMKDLPTKDWIHDVEKYGYTNFRGTVPGDPYASQYDKDKLIKGWFVPEMPDLNQRNELLADYLIQNTLWWIEYSGIDGIRMDTYIYPYKEYMARWAKEVLEAYPHFNIIGEAWVETVAHEAFWQYDPKGMHDGYDSHLPTVTDFPFSFAVRKGLVEDFEWETGLRRIYYLLAQDSLYADASKNVIFLDNHDMSRIYEQLGKDEDLFKMAYSILLTSRGIPQVYYGTELMMGHENRGGDDEAWRQTMPGGWEGDSRNVFKKRGRTDQENEIYRWVAKLNNWRKTAIAVHQGKLVHFIPEDNTYIYFRIHREQTVMVALNRNEEKTTIQLSRFEEVHKNFTSGRDIATNQRVPLQNEVTLDSKSALILELEN
ncbi:MAG: glycoside hydrolase family 13 protein [Verrucomicrobiota bacterium]